MILEIFATQPISIPKAVLGKTFYLLSFEMIDDDNETSLETDLYGENEEGEEDADDVDFDLFDDEKSDF